MRTKQDSLEHGGMGRLAVCSVAMVVLTGCGAASSGSSASSGSTCTSPTAVHYGHIAFAGDAVVVLAQQEGYFRQECLTVEIDNVAAINNVVPGVVGGTYDFGLQAGGSVAVAESHGIPVQIVANDYFHQKEQQLMVKTGGPIKSLKDLQGQTVSLGALNNNYEAGLFSQLQQAGVDPTSVKFETSATNQIASLVESGQVAAGQINEPFITQEGNKLTTVADPLDAFGSQPANAYVIVDTDWANSHKDVVRRFLRAYNKAQKLAASNRALIASVVSSYTGISTSVTSTMNMPGFGPALHEQSELQQQSFMLKYGFLTKDPGKNIFYSGVDIQALASQA